MSDVLYGECFRCGKPTSSRTLVTGDTNSPTAVGMLVYFADGILKNETDVKLRLASVCENEYQGGKCCGVLIAKFKTNEEDTLIYEGFTKEAPNFHEHALGAVFAVNN